MRNTNLERTTRTRYDLAKIDSGAEHEFIHAFVKFSRCNFIQQHPCKTKDRTYRLDFVIDKDGDKYGVEVDGNQHKLSIEYDDERDRAILDNGFVKGIIRIPAWLCTHYRFMAVLYVLNCLPDNFAVKDFLYSYIHSESLYVREINKDGIKFFDAELEKDYTAECKTKGKVWVRSEIPEALTINRLLTDFPRCDYCGKHRKRAYENICIECA